MRIGTYLSGKLRQTLESLIAFFTISAGALICLWSWATPGIVMSHDMSFPPNATALSRYVGQGFRSFDFHAVTGGPHPTGPAITAEYWLPLLMLSRVIPYDVATKVALVGPLIAAAFIGFWYFRFRFGANVLSSTLAAFFVGFNPWILERIVQGHIFIVGPYWLIIWIGLQTAHWFEHDDYRLLFGQQVMLFFLFPLEQHFVIMFDLATFAGIVAKSTANVRAALLLLFPVAGLLCSAWTFYNTFLYYTQGAVWYSPVEQFFSSSRFSSILNVLSLKSSWVAPYDTLVGNGALSELFACIAAITAVILLVAAAVRPGSRYIFFVGVAAVILGMGTAAPFGLGALAAWAIAHVPLANAFRDPNKWLLFLVLSLALASCRRFTFRNASSWCLAAMCVLVLFSARPYMTQSFRQQVRPVTIPAYYAQAFAKLNALSPGVVLALPTIPEVKYTWSAAPIRLLLYYYVGSQSILTNDFFLPHYLGKIGPDLEQRLWSHKRLGLVDPELNSLGVQYVLVDTSARPSWVWRAQLASVAASQRLRLLFRTGQILLFERKGTTDAIGYSSIPRAQYGSPSGLAEAELLARTRHGSMPVVAADENKSGEATFEGTRIGEISGLRTAFDPQTRVQVAAAYRYPISLFSASSRSDAFPPINLSDVKQSGLFLTSLVEGTSTDKDGNMLWGSDSGRLVLDAFVSGPLSESARVTLNGLKVGSPAQITVSVNGNVVAHTFVKSDDSPTFTTNLKPFANRIVIDASPATAGITSLQLSQAIRVDTVHIQRGTGAFPVTTARLETDVNVRQLLASSGISGKWQKVNIPAANSPTIIVSGLHLSSPWNPLVLVVQLTGSSASGFYFFPIFGSGTIPPISLSDIVKYIHAGRPESGIGSVTSAHVSGYGILSGADPSSMEASFGDVSISRFTSTAEHVSKGSANITAMGPAILAVGTNQYLTASFSAQRDNGKMKAEGRACERRGFNVALASDYSGPVTIALSNAALNYNLFDGAGRSRIESYGVVTREMGDIRISVDSAILKQGAGGQRDLFIAVPGCSLETVTALMLGNGTSDLSFFGRPSHTETKVATRLLYDPLKREVESQGSGIAEFSLPIVDGLKLCGTRCVAPSSEVNGFGAAWKVRPGTYKVEFRYPATRRFAAWLSAVATAVFLTAWLVVYFVRSYSLRDEV